MNPPSTIQIAGRRLPRLGFGTMQLPGPRGFGPSPDPQAAISVLRRAIELGVRLVDTAGYYGPDVANELIAKALRPYPRDLFIASKVGAARTPDGGFEPEDTPGAVRAAVEKDLQVLGIEALDLVHARRMPGTSVPYAETVGALAQLHDEGQVRAIGVSNVTLDELDEARTVAPIASVENEYNLVDRAADPVLAAAEQLGLAFLPFHPLRLGELAAADGIVGELAVAYGITPAQLTLAWLLHRSPALLPIPGTRSIAHLEQNVAAASVRLEHADVERLAQVSSVSARSSRT